MRCMEQIVIFGFVGKHQWAATDGQSRECSTGWSSGSLRYWRITWTQNLHMHQQDRTYCISGKYILKQWICSLLAWCFMFLPQPLIIILLCGTKTLHLCLVTMFHLLSHLSVFPVLVSFKYRKSKHNYLKINTWTLLSSGWRKSAE